MKTLKSLRRTLVTTFLLLTWAALLLWCITVFIYASVRTWGWLF